MTAFIVPACLLAYTVMTLLVARWRYQATRPYTEPLACDDPAYCGDRHSRSCYRRAGLIDTTGEAVVFALLRGLAWPLIGPALLVRRIVITGAPELPEELQAQIQRLEAENDRLKQQLDGG